MPFITRRGGCPLASGQQKAWRGQGHELLAPRPSRGPPRPHTLTAHPDTCTPHAQTRTTHTQTHPPPHLAHLPSHSGPRSPRGFPSSAHPHVARGDHQGDRMAPERIAVCSMPLRASRSQHGAGTGARPVLSLSTAAGDRGPLLRPLPSRGGGNQSHSQEALGVLRGTGAVGAEATLKAVSEQRAGGKEGLAASAWLRALAGRGLVLALG